MKAIAKILIIEPLAGSQLTTKTIRKGFSGKKTFESVLNN